MPFFPMKNMFAKTHGTLSIPASPSSFDLHHDYIAIHFSSLTIIAKGAPPHDLDLADRPALQLLAHLEAEGWVADEVMVLTRAGSEDLDAAPSPSSAQVPRSPAAIPGSGAAFAQLSRIRSGARNSPPRLAGPAATPASPPPENGAPLDEAEANAETWFQARALRLAAKHLAGLQAVLSYCDPVARTALDGTVTAPGHLGTIYRAGNARSLGLSSPRTLKLMPDGRIASGRALSMIRTEDQGAAYASQLLVSAGAPRRLPMESGTAYLQRIDAAGFFRRIRHPGNLVIGWDVRRFAPQASRHSPC